LGNPPNSRRPILALDLGGCIGWAAAHPGDQPRWGHQFIPEGGPPAAFSFLRGWLGHHLEALDPAVVAIEGPILNHFGQFKTGLPTAIRLIGYYAIALQLCDERAVRCETYSAVDIKKHFSGNGAAKKPEMVAMALALGWTTEMDDEADALGLLCLAEARLSRVRRQLPALPLFS